MRTTTTEELSQLKKTMDAVYPLPKDDRDAFAECWHSIQAAKHQALTVAGNIEQYLYFVTGGVQRIFYLDEQDREATLIFTYAPSFGGVVDSLLLRQPSRYYFETITASSFMVLHYEDLSKLMKDRSAIQQFVNRALTISLSGVLERMTELQSFSSEEKFRQLLKRSPHILNLVPQKYLANYIGINATNFSKMVNSIRI